MRQKIKSALLALVLLFGMTAVAQAQGGNYNVYNGTFSSSTLPFKSFRLYLYENGSVYGFLSSNKLDDHKSEPKEYASFTRGRYNRSGVFVGEFVYKGKTYNVRGTGNRQSVIATVTPDKSSRRVGTMIGKIDRRSNYRS